MPRQPQDNPKGKLTTGRVFRRHTAHFALWGRPHLLGHTNLWYIGAESDFSQPFLNKNDQFTKTGSGQVLEEPKEYRESKNVVFCSRPGERHLVRRRAGLQGRSLGQGDGAKNASRFQYDLTLQCLFDTTNDRFTKTGSGQT